LTIPLTFVVGSGTLAIVPSSASLTFFAPPVPPTQSITLAGSNGASIGFSIASTAAWLSATSSQGYTPATLTVTANATNLANGVYQGSITITPTEGGALLIPVTLQVGPNTLSAMPLSLAFDYSVGGTPPPAQAVQLASSLSTDTYTAQATSAGNWLLVNGVTANVSGGLPAILNVTVNAVGLAPGNYQGTITVADANKNTQTVTVTLAVFGISDVVNPTSLVFVAQYNGPAPAPQTVAVNGFGAATYTATVNETWLSASSSGGTAPAQLIVSANPAGLGVGTYNGTVQIDLDLHLQTIQVTLIVSAGAVLTTTPGDFLSTYDGGSAPPSPLNLEVNVSSGGSQSFTIAAGLPSWIQVSPNTPLSAPDVLDVNLTPQTLPTGTYLAQIILVPAVAGNPAVVVPVLLTVENATSVVPNVTSLSFTAGAGGAPQSQTVEVTAATSTPFSVTATSTGNWLTVSPASGTASLANTPITVTADATNLGQGIYSGTITLTTAGGVITQIPVTFTVGNPSGPLGISPSTLAFAYTQGAGLPPAQSVQITGSQSFTAGASTSNGGTWLAVTPSSGTGNLTLSVSVNPAGLAPGPYNGSITVTPTGGAAQTVGVTMIVAAPGVLSATPNPVVFAYAAGNPPPAAQTVTVTATGQPVAFTATASSSGWLSVTQNAATTPAILAVTVNPINLGAGSYNGSIALSGGSGTTQLIINVALTVTAPLPVIGGVVNAASYLEGALAPGEIVTLFGTALGPVTGVGATIDSKGFIETTLANVSVTFSGYPAPILFANSTQINAIVPYELAGAASASIEAQFGSARSNSVIVPVVASAPAIFSADASGQGPGAIQDLSYHLVTASNPVSGGSYIQIFATGQGQTSPGGVDGLIEPLTLPLPVPLLPVEVTVGGVVANLQYVGAAPGLVAGALQVNVEVPDGLPSGPAALVVSFGGVDFSQPGITVAIK
jgi:uncharacterized protein (TIGR03437 family)